VTASLLLFNVLDADSTTGVVIAISMLMGLGMANIMAPATDSIMGSLPRAKAGVGSAMNDTTRQVGGAVGVAVLGSLLASHYTRAMDSKLGGVVPAQLLENVRDSVGQATGVVREVPAAQPFAAEITRAAQDSFVGGMHLAFTVAAGVTLLAAIGVARFLPARPGEAEPVPAAAPAPDEDEAAVPALAD
jgi:hypothetical protein